MNKRQAKKAYKKKHGFNPPKDKQYATFLDNFAFPVAKMYREYVNRIADNFAEAIKSVIPAITAAVNAAVDTAKEAIEKQKEERRIIEDFAAAGKVPTQGMSSAINALQAAKALQIAQSRPQRLIIANAATAAAIRKQFTREEVEIIITPVVETGTAYVVVDENLKQQLLESIEKRGY